VLITNEFHEFCSFTFSGTSDDEKASYGPKSLHIFIMSKIGHSHRQCGTKRRCGTKPVPNRAKGWPAGHTSLASRPGFGVFSKSIFNTCQLKLARCHTRFLCQNRVLIVCMTQDQMFHIYGQKGSQKTICHNIKYN
jgi:hypothetical protein